MTNNNKFIPKTGRLNRILATLREDEDIGKLIIETTPSGNQQKKKNEIKKKQLPKSKQKTNRTKNI
jgi:hypothetical protein